MAEIDNGIVIEILKSNENIIFQRWFQHLYRSPSSTVQWLILCYEKHRIFSKLHLIYLI